MYSPYLTSLVGRFYWNTVKRWPVVHVLCCFIGIAVGVGCLYLFGTAEPNERKAVFLRVLGILMLLGYGWWTVAFVIRYVRGTWPSHCDKRIALFDAL
jgi:hypothetical protein